MDLSSITSLLSAGAPYSGAITALADLGIDITKLITPDVAQQFTEASRSRLQQFIDIMAKADGDARADQLNRYFSQLCVDAGTPAIGLGGDISVPVAFLGALCAIACKYIADEGIINQLTIGARQPAAAPSVTGAGK